MYDVEGAKAGSKQKQPYRAPVSSTTNQRMRIKYGISEGTILGFGQNFTQADMLKRIYLDGTPIMSAEGEQLLDVVVEFRKGEQDQEPINGLPSLSVENGVGVEVKIASPVSRAFAREETTSFDIRVSVPQLYDGDAEGNSRKGTIQFRIEIATDGGAFVSAGDFTIKERILNGWSNTYTVAVPQGSTHTVRVSRLNSEVVSDFSVNRLILDAIVEVTDVKLRYSNIAILYLEYDAEQFSNVPKLEMQIYGKDDILVPSNYDSFAKTYATSGTGTTGGVWDGTWKRAYTDNPVWIWLDLITSKRYGLGERITLDLVDKWELYGLSQYCDAQVPDGQGGFEPRFTCNNMYLQKSEDAYRVLKDLAASIRAKTVWDGEFLSLLADVPREPVMTFSEANVKDISYSSTQDSAQRNLINVQYYDRTNKFTSDVVMKRNMQSINERGKVVEGNFTALGCTSKGQAQRIASYVLNTELYETEIATFTTGLDGFMPRLNDVIYLADSSVSGRMISGRVAAINGTQVTLDRALDPVITAGASTQLVLNRDDIQTAPIAITAISADRLTVTLASAPPDSTAVGLVWALLTADLVPRKMSITDIEFLPDEMAFAISAIEYNESKYAAIDGGARIVAPPISVIDYGMLKAPTIVTATYTVSIVQDINVCHIDVSWSQVSNAVAYQLEMQKDGGEWRVIGRYASLSATLENAYTGLYAFRVCAYDSIKNASPYRTSEGLLVAGKTLPPPVLDSYAVSGILLGYQHSWVYPAHTEDSRSVRIRKAFADPNTVLGQTYIVWDVAYPTNTFTEQGQQANLTAWFSAAIVDKYGIEGEYTTWQSAQTNNDPSELLELLNDSITESQLSQDLTTKIDKIDTFDQRIIDAEVAMAEMEENVSGVLDSQDYIANEQLILAERVNGVYVRAFPKYIGSTEDFIGSTAYASVYTIQQAQIEGDKVLATRIDVVEAALGEDFALFKEEIIADVQAAQATADDAFFSATTAQGVADDALFNAATAQTAASNAQTAASNAQTAASNAQATATAAVTATTTLQTQVNGNTASIQTQQSSIDGINLQYTVKLDSNGYVSGFGLMNSGATSEFIVRANKFAIAPPSGNGNTATYAFVYQATTSTLPNGTIVPAGLYLNDAFIGKLSASKIDADSLSAISANLGTLNSTAADGSRTNMTGSGIRIYYPDGTLAVKLSNN